MDRTFEITPEMLGFTWKKVISDRTWEVAVLFFTAFGWKYYRGGSVNVSELVIAAICTLGAGIWTARASAKRIHLTDTEIEEIDGPVISKDTIVEVRERSKDVAGLTVLGARSYNFLPKYEIFIPKSVAGYDEVRAVLLSWAPTFTYAES